jgi:RNA polymerase sigma-70 factor (ECF subfamily)
MQETLAEAFNSVENYQGRSRLETWLFGIAINVARNHVAKATRNQRFVELTDDIAGDVPGSCNPLAVVDARRRLQAINDKLDRLTPELRKTFDCVFIHGMAYQEAAEAMDIPVGTVRSRLFKLRAILGNSSDEIAD